MRALLDVNVLIALLDAGHAHHATASNWLRQNVKSGWASCPITQNGTIRILSQPAYPNAVTTADAGARLREAIGTIYHEFWADGISMLDDSLFNWSVLLNARHLTDAYLLALAVSNNGRLVTLDRGISLTAVPKATRRHLVVI
ncbi:MAG: TA system VapC family ribonuclease toxin [Rudaea sp.]